MLEGYTGWHGEGKTYCATLHCVRWHNDLCRHADRAGRPHPEVWSNVPIDGARRFLNFAELLQLLEEAATEGRRVLVLVDEAGTWLPSRFWSKMPEGILAFLQQRRRVGAGVDIIWTAPSIEHVDKMLRDVTQVAHTCKRYGGTEYSHDGGRAPRVFRVQSFDPREVTKAKRKRRGAQWVPFVAEIGGLYETQTVELNRSAHEELAERPDVYGDGDRHEPTRPVVGVTVHTEAPRKKGRRR
jgi:hypothetical protein